jgi:RNA polymerase sigma factor (sigma-70 family)
VRILNDEGALRSRSRAAQSSNNVTDGPILTSNISSISEPAPTNLGAEVAAVVGVFGGKTNLDRKRDELTARFRAPLFAYFLKRVRDRAEAEDLTQEAFVRLTNRPDQRDGEAIHAYVFTIASNLLRDRARSRFVRGGPHSSLDEIIESSVSTLVEDRTPERVLLAKEALKEVVATLGELGDRTRDIFILSRLENVPHREIAALYGISVSAVEKHVIKALAHLGARNMKP